MQPRRPRWLLPVAAFVLVLAAVLWNTRLPATFIAPPVAAQSMGAAGQWNQLGSNAAPVAASLAPSPAPDVPQIVLETTDGAYRDDQLQALRQPLDDVLRYVQERTGMQLQAPITIQFSNERGCSLSGVAYTTERRIKLFVCPDVALERATSILAHEFVHQLAADHYGKAHYQADLMLSEGIAQWGAGKYKLRGHPDFRTLVRTDYPYDLLPLPTDSRDVDSFTIMRHLYDQWAAYVEWIVATKDRAALDKLYVGGDDRKPGSAPYADVLGMPLEQAEQAWKAWIEQ